jgi:uncharacterized protein
MRLLSIVLAGLLAGCATFNVTETHFFHPGPAKKPPSSGMGIETGSIRAADGTELGTTYVVAKAADVEILYFGGDSFRIDDVGEEIATLVTPLGANVFFMDYRGYGRSAGKPTVEAVKSDALLAYDELRKRAGDRPIVVHGFSLGSFMAAHVAVSRPVAGLVLESTAPDVEGWAKAQIPMYAKASVRLKIAPALLLENNAARLKSYRQPLLLLTGSKDAITPPRFAQSLYSVAASTDKKVLIVEGANHGDVLAFSAATAEYGRFLERVRVNAGRDRD